MDDAAERAARSARELARRIGVDHHDVLVVLGSGLSGVAELLGGEEDWVPLDTLPFFPTYTAAGHRSHGWSMELAGRRLLVLGGRRHLYEGLEPAEVVHPLRTGIAAGCSTVILTAAAGGIREDLVSGQRHGGRGPPQPDGTQPAAGAGLRRHGRRLLAGAARARPGDARTRQRRRHWPSGPASTRSCAGPQFETPAEIRMLKTMGADVVGMSMALETIAARAGRRRRPRAGRS